ncbi:MAG: S8 family serine peptidase [Candidatus Eisenbacteria bacterium]
MPGQAARTGPRDLGLGATPELAARALQAGVQGVEAPFRDLDLREDPMAPDAPEARLARTWRLVLAPGADPRAAARALAGAAEVELAEPDAVYHLAWTGPVFLPDDPLFADGTQWGLANSGAGPYGGVSGVDVRAPLGWAITSGSSATILGIVDTGFDLHHPELNRDLADGSPRVIARYNSSIESDYGTPDDSVGHGTIVAGVALALTNNGPLLGGSGVAGMCGGSGGDSVGCRVVEVKATPTSHTDVLSSELVKGIIFAANSGARAINLSFGGDEDNDNVREAIATAATRGAVVICGAGNGQDERPQYPGYYARYGLGVSVAAIRSDGTLARFSSRGPQIDVAAPGEDIMSTYLTYENAYASPLRNFAASSGTSFAAPFVTGLAGLAYTIQPDMRNNEFQEMLRRTARDVGEPGRDDTYGWGIPDAQALLSALLPPRGFVRGLVRAQTWSLVGSDSVTLSRTKLNDQRGCPIDGRYLAERWEVRAHVDLPPGRLLETPEVIVRKKLPNPALPGTNGWDAGPLLEYNVGWGELVPGSASASGFDVRSYVYRIASPTQNVCGAVNIDFVPARPADVFFDWSAFGRLDLPPTWTVDAPRDSAVLDVDAPTTLAFHATDTDTVSAIQIAYSSDGGASWITAANLPGTATTYRFQSPCTRPGEDHRLRFRALDTHGGWSDQSDLIRRYFPSRLCLPGEDPDAPASFAFLPVTPNPSAGGPASFHFSLPESAPGGAGPRLRIFDLRGRLVREIDLAGSSVGPVGAAWDGVDRSGRTAPAGMYVARLDAGGRSATRRFVRLATGAR